MPKLIMAEVRCKCGKYVNVRMKEINRGDSHSVACWNCNRLIKLQNEQGYCEGVKAPTTVVLSETLKDNGG